jgi:hypothetical protein
MPLDWEPLPTPRRGYEKEFLDLFHELGTATGAKRERVMKWFANVAVPAYETLGAPRVGFDAEADDWLHDRLVKSGRDGELDQIRVEMHGYNVLELMPPCDGFPVYSNHKADERLDRYSFHAELLAGVADALGTELCERAHTMMLPDAHEEFAVRLHEVAAAFSAEHELPDHVATIREPVYPEGSVERRGHLLFAAAKWCTFWSLRGHGLAVSF